MKKIIIITILLSIVSISAFAQLNGKIKIYFTNPVNTSVSTGVNAVYLNNSMDDTLVAYINRAKYTIDIAVYNYQQSTGMANIANAINTAQTNGVVVRWIYDAAQSNSGMTALNSNIYALGSPTTSAYGIMHNKFMIIDASSSNIDDPLVWTGSTNWTKTHFNSNVNNTVIIQDKNLALAYLTEFNEMWGSTGITPNTSTSKFGPFKTNNTPHLFTIGTKTVEVYFSPSDGAQAKTINAIKSANTDVYFGMLTFSQTNYSDSIINKKNNGIYVAGISDQSSNLYPPYSALNSSLGAMFEVYSSFTSVYHNKILLVDPSNINSDPMVLTGSFNWSNPAETLNDENLVIIHDATVANIFYQSFSQNFIDLGGSLSVVTDLKNVSSLDNNINIFPNPTNNLISIKLGNNLFGSTFIITDLLGKQIIEGELKNEITSLDISDFCKGIYFIKVGEQNKKTFKVVKL